MKKGLTRLLLLLFLLGNCVPVFAQSPCSTTTFLKSYGKIDFAWDIIETSDHGFITGGWTDNDVSVLMKIDSKGDVVWTKKITGNNTPIGFWRKFIRLSDGKYIAVGRAYNALYHDTWVIKFEEDGNIIWNKEVTFPNGIATDPQSVYETADKGLVLACSYQKIPNIGGSVIMKLNANGDPIWNKECSSGISAKDIIEKNGVLFIVGTQNSSLSGIITKMNSADGTFLEAKGIVVENKYTVLYNITEKNNKFYITGNSRDSQKDSLKQVVMIMDIDLSILKVFKFDLGFRRSWEEPAMSPTDDGGFIVATGNEYNADLTLFKISYDGLIEWKKQYLHPGSQYTFYIKATADNGIIGVGATNPSSSYYGASNDALIYKADAIGLLGDCIAADAYGIIYTPSFEASSRTFPYDPVSFPVISLNSNFEAFTVPVTTFCEKIIVQSCTSFKVSGRDIICNLSDTVIYKAIRNNGCNAALSWKLNDEFIRLIDQTDSTVSVQFKKAGSTMIVSGLENPCETAADSMAVHILVSPRSINFGPDKLLCQDSSYTLHAGQGFRNYQWQNGSTDSILVAKTPGIYYVSAINHCNEEFSDIIVISQAPSPIDFLPADTAICAGESIALKPVYDFKNYLWSTGETTRQITVSLPAPYWLSVTNEYGCFTKEYINVKEKPGCIIALYFPNAFSPNNDGMNDQFKAGVYGLLKSFHLVIYNRYGNVIFETRDVTKGWDGKLKGVTQDSGAFVWFCEYQFGNTLQQTKKGTVMLLR